MTIMQAHRMEKICPDFKRKGRIQVGADAYLAIFDPNTIIARATFDNPATESWGMKHVLVNGHHLIENGILHMSHGGRPLRAKAK